MKRIKILFYLIILCISAKGQYFNNNNLNSMVQAEFDFAKLAKEQNTRAAFLSFCNSESIGFSNGPISMQKTWEARKSDSSLLAWRPDYAVVSISGDLGFDAGPCQYYKTRHDVKPLGIGHFITLWKRDSMGVWKVAIDIGISYAGSQDLLKLETAEIAAKNVGSSVNDDIHAIENELNSTDSENLIASYSKLLSNEARFYYDGNQPIIQKDSIIIYIKSKKPKVRFSYLKSIISKSGDLFATYGTAVVNVNENSTYVTKNANYLRFWKKEDGTNWKLVVEVVSFD